MESGIQSRIPYLSVTPRPVYNSYAMLVYSYNKNNTYREKLAGFPVLVLILYSLLVPEEDIRKIVETLLNLNLSLLSHVVFICLMTNKGDDD